MKLLSQLFNTSSEKRFSFYKLYSNLTKWDKAGRKPYSHELPDSILLPAEFWSSIIKLYKATLSDGFERAATVFWVDGELIVTGVTKGSRSSVHSNNKIVVKFTPAHKKDYLKKEIIVDNKVYKTTQVYYKKRPKKIEIVPLFNVHTHPRHTDSNGHSYYSFFSAQDIKSLVGNRPILSGMIGDKLWLIIKTDATPQSVNITDQQINPEFLEKELRIALYSGEFKGKLTRYDLS